MSGTYCDVIVVEKLVQIEGAKTLQLMYYGGLPYAVSKSIQIGDVVAVFTPDSQISEEFAKANDLVGYIDEITGAKKGGFFAKNRKVRSITLMQGKIRSVGFVASQEQFDYLGISLKDLVGQSFNEINGRPICNKYILTGPNGKPVNGKAKVGKLVKDKFTMVGMPEHQDTKMFYKFADTLKVGDVVYITLKLDGCVSKDTIVDTLEFGAVSIGYLVDNRIRANIKSMNVISKEIEYCPITDWFLRKDTADWYEVELEDGRKITITGNNPVWLNDLQCYREVKDLIIGNSLTVS